MVTLAREGSWAGSDARTGHGDVAGRNPASTTLPGASVWYSSGVGVGGTAHTAWCEGSSWNSTEDAASGACAVGQSGGPDYRHTHTRVHTHTHTPCLCLLQLLWTFWAPGFLWFTHEMVHRDNFCSNKHHSAPFPAPARADAPEGFLAPSTTTESTAPGAHLGSRVTALGVLMAVHSGCSRVLSTNVSVLL